MQRRFPGSAGYLGRTAQTSLAALIAAASYVDPGRINSLASAHSWVLWLVENGETAAESWLNDANVALSIQEQELISIRSHGGRTASSTSVASTSVVSPEGASTSGAGTSSLLPPPMPDFPMPDFPMPDFPMPDMNVVQSVADATGAGLGESMDALKQNRNDPDAATNDLLDLLEDPDDLFGAASQASVKDHKLAQELFHAGASLAQLVRAGFEVSILAEMFHARDLKAAGVSLEDMVMDKDLEELEKAFSYEELRRMGFSDEELGR